jgi:putative membrane protein
LSVNTNAVKEFDTTSKGRTIVANTDRFNYINNMYLTEDQQNRISALGRNLEMRTGVEFMSAVVGKCDTYPEIPWKGFALGAALSALGLVLYQLWQPAWQDVRSPLLLLAWVLGIGALTALLTSFRPGLARLFLNSERAEEESRQYAQGLFIEQELFRTRQRKALLLLIGLFERRVILLPDSSIRARLKPEQLEKVIRQMVSLLRQGNHFQALVQGIALIENMLLEAGFKGPADASDQIPAELIQQKGNQA